MSILFQTIAYRWAQNLAGYDAPEVRRFGRSYEAMAPSSSVTVARAHATIN